ncbi:MAG: response regulator [Firmicutes bacterium]|nr:response regulator [Bacillota bacterium]
MNNPKILVVDDELGPREALRMILRDDYDVFTADSGKQALNYLKSSEFDLMILDIRMPDINGIDLLAKVKEEAPETEVVMITAYASVDTAANALRNGALDYLIKPFDSSSVKEAVEKGLSRRSLKTAVKNRLSELQVVNKTLKEEVERAYTNIRKHYTETVRSLTAAVDAKDSYTKGHQERVAVFATILGENMGLSTAQLELLQQAAILHDIGKIGVPEHILKKTSTLTPEEHDVIKKHPAIGAEIISHIEFLKDIIPIVLHHHENFDGTGYPEGIKGRKIPRSARIIAVADAIDAMLSDRPYAPARSVEEVRHQLKLYSGTQFDPEIAAVALKIDLPSRRIKIYPER